MKNATETSLAAQNLSQNLNMFLFLKNICEINFDITESFIVKIDRTKKDRITLQKGNNSKIDWLVNTVSLEVPNDVKAVLQDERNIPEKLLNADSIELCLAAKIGNDGITKLSNQEKLLYSYLPTDETKYSIPVLVNTSFLTAANRESLHADSKWNQWLFKIIAIEIFKWISKLVNTEYHFQAYQLIPRETISDELGKNFNDGIKEAIKSIPFVVSRKDQLIKIDETIVDFTYLSEKYYIGEEPIKKFIIESNGYEIGSPKQFAKSSGFFSEFKRLGAACFEWTHFQRFLASTYFKEAHNIAHNIELIKHLKKLCESDKVMEISKDALMKLPFIWDHKNHISYPHQVCFPTADDQNWDNPNSELSFLHKQLQIWLLKDSEIRHWLESLGVQEKTDITYITQTIIPKIDNYITPQNAMQTIRDLFNLYKKGNLKEDLIRQLSEIKLLTKNGSLCPAKDSFLSDYYKPRLEIEKIIENDIFISETYCLDLLEKDEWKRFFKLLGVHEGITALQYTNRINCSALTYSEFYNEYFEAKDKRFTPFQSTFKSDCYSNLITLSYIQLTEKTPKFSYKFWFDFIENHSPNIVDTPAIAYWGYENRPGQTSGDRVENYVSWFIKNIQCIPTLSEKCETVVSVFLNTEEIKVIAGKYLPVFNGPELSADWRAFFNFRTRFELSDYLELLGKISSDLDDKGRIKKDNHKKIQSIYSALLAQCANWSTADIEKVEEWANTGFLQNTKNQFTECCSLKYFLDGNDGIFQEQYDFVMINAENKAHPNLIMFLKCFNVSVLRQSEFELISVRDEVCSSLKKKLESIYKCFRDWIKSENQDAAALESLVNLEDKIEKLKIYQAVSLAITYNVIDFTKGVNVHFDEDVLYVTTPWNSNSVLLKLSEVLVRYFNLAGHDKKLDFLLRSTNDEIQRYFVQENILVSADGLIPMEDFKDAVKSTNALVESEILINQNTISQDFFDTTIHDFGRQQYIKQLIPRAENNVLAHLAMLPEYDCSSSYVIAESIISGITKNGNEITVVARPSDYDKIRLHYDAEFDVLEYVDAELWYEDGVTPPKQFTFGQLLKMTGINKLPIKNIHIKDSEIETFLYNPRSEVFDFNAVPYSPEKTARIISSFSNTNGGTLVFGIKETSSLNNEIVGLSSEFKVVEITKKAISMLSPIPAVTFDWLMIGEQSIFVVRAEKSDGDILLNEQKYIRESAASKLEEAHINSQCILNNPDIKRTIAIIIAIETYYPKQRNQIPPVKYADSDAIKFKETLLSELGISEDDIYILRNEQAIKTEVEDVVKYQIFSMSEDDRLIFYYVGHGFHNGVSNYLSTYDMSQYDIANTAISLRKLLLDPLKQSKCKNALICIDACAQSFADENARSSLSNINDEELIIFSNDFPYYALFLSCQTGEKSYSCDDLKNGIWTHHLVEAIKGNVHEIVKDNRYITDRALGDYLSHSVSQYVKNKLGFDQNPKTILDASYENVIVDMG